MYTVLCYLYKSLLPGCVYIVHDINNKSEYIYVINSYFIPYILETKTE